MGFLSSLFGNSDKARRQSHVMNLLYMACADGEVDESEVEVILHIANRIGLSQEEFDQIMSAPDSIKFTLPNTLEERVTLLYDMVLVMMADGELHEDEIDSCCTMAERLEFDSDIIGTMVEETIKAMKNDVPFDRVLARLIKIAKAEQ